MTAEELIKFSSRHVRKIFDKNGQVLPMYHYIRGDGEHAVFAPPAFCRSKDMMVEFAKKVFEAERAIAYVFVNEAWTLEQRKSQEDITRIYERYGSLEHVPGRREVIMFTAEDAQHQRLAQIEIHRPAGRQPYLGELEMSPDGGELEGRMVGILPRTGTQQ